MKVLLKEIKRYLIIYGMFIKNCVIKQMEYRAHFFMMFSIELAFVLVKLLYVFVVKNTGVGFYDLSPDAIYLFMGTFMINCGIYMAMFYFNFAQISHSVVSGDLDFMITKPISLQFMITLRVFDIGTAIPNFICGAIIIVYGWIKMDIATNFLHIFTYLLLIICGSFISYSIMLLPNIISFWLVKTDSFKQFTDSLWEFNDMPMVIYDKWMQSFCVFVFPIFLISNIPSLFAINQLSDGLLFWAIAAPILFFVIVRMFWSFAIKNYSSASS